MSEENNDEYVPIQDTGKIIWANISLNMQKLLPHIAIVKDQQQVDEI